MFEFNDNICLMSDSYKFTHPFLYPKDLKYVYSYMEARLGSKFNKTVFFGLQYILKKYLCGKVVSQEKIDEADKIISAHIGPGIFPKEDWEYILKTYEGKLPVSIYAPKEGSVIDINNVLMVVQNYDEKVPWLTNYLETILLQVWYPITIATLSREEKIEIYRYLKRTGCDINTNLKFALHDFGYRGATCNEQAALGDCAHLVNFFGTDTVPGMLLAMKYYNCKDVPAFSIKATEHSVMTQHGEEGEFDIVDMILNNNPDGNLAMVIDSYNYQRFIDTCGTRFKDIINKRNGRTIFRPDSGDPNTVALDVIERLGKHFGYTTNQAGFRVLPDNIRALWGDGIDLEGIKGILYTLYQNHWAAENICFGQGGGLVQKVNRDTCRFAFKCSCAEDKDGWHDVYKKPLDMSKASKRGKLCLMKFSGGNGNCYYKTERLTPYNKIDNQLQLVFQNGELKVDDNLDDIRKRAEIKQYDYK